MKASSRVDSSPASPKNGLYSAYDAGLAGAYIQPHGVLLVARQSDLCFTYVSANAERVTRIPPQEMLGKSILDCLSAEICSKIIHYDQRKRLVYEQGRRQTIVSGVGTRHHVQVLHHNDLIYIEMELEILEPEADRLPVRAQMVVASLRAANSTEELLHMTARSMRELTGYARVMAYRFERDGHGHVVAEDRMKGMVPYRGLHFPIADVPLPVRSRCLKQPIRIIGNTDYEPVPMLGLAGNEAQEAPLDMTVCTLRSGSAVQLDYVRKMGAGAVLMLSLIVEGELWGLLIFHHTSPKLPSPEMRGTCELLGQIVSSLIQDRQHAGKQVETAARDHSLNAIAASLEERNSIFDSLIASQEHLLKSVRAFGAFIRFRGQSRAVGIAPSETESLELMKALRTFAGNNLFDTDHLAGVVAETSGSLLGTCGALMLPIAGEAGDGILWFRPASNEVMVWGGRMGKKVVADPRTGEVFAKRQLGRWQTVESERSLPWEKVDLDAAVKLGALLAATSVPVHKVELETGRSEAANLIAPAKRSALESRLRAWVDDPDRAAAALIAVSIEHFNLVEIAYGQTIADELVHLIENRISALRSAGSIFFSRLDANKFAVFWGGCSEDEANVFLEHLQHALECAFQVRGQPFHFVPTLGMAHSTWGHDESLLQKAEVALEFAENSNRRHVRYSLSLHTEVTRLIQLEQDLYNACEEGQFYLLYQPIVSLPLGELIGFEALLRWNHPERGILSPNEFIPLAESEGMMVEVGRWVLAAALQQLRVWVDMCGPRLRMHINIAAQQLASEGLVQTARSMLEKYDLPASAVSIEVTESTLLCEAAARRLHELRMLGIGISADDFGTGYSCLASLRRLPLDVIKIDKEFIRPIAGDLRSREFVATILQLARTLDLQTIAEGVETEEQAHKLTELGCPAAQGYYYSMPLTLDEATQLLERCRTEEWRLLPIGKALPNAA